MTATDMEARWRWAEARYGTGAIPILTSFGGACQALTDLLRIESPAVIALRQARGWAESGPASTGLTALARDAAVYA